MAKQKNAEKCCENCASLCGIGCGDHICEENPCLMVLDGYVPTDDYFWCDGAKWKEG